MRTVNLVVWTTLLAVPATARANEWRADIYKTSAQSYVARQLAAEKGIVVNPEAVVIDDTKSTLPRFRTRTGKATIAWSVNQDGLSITGKALMKGDMGVVLGHGAADGKQVIFESMNDQAKAQTATWRNKIDARNETVPQAKAMFQNEVARVLSTQGFNVEPTSIKAERWKSSLEGHSYLFKNKCNTPGGTRLFKGHGAISIQWQGTKPTLSVKNVEVTKNRQTFGSYLRSKFSRRRPPCGM